MNNDQTGLGLVNGQVSELAKAQISLNDNGFLLGDGVFETMRTTSRGNIFRASLHLERAKRGLQKLLISLPNNFDDLFAANLDMLHTAGLDAYGKDLYLRLNISTATSKVWQTNPELAFSGIAKHIDGQSGLKPVACKTTSLFGQKHELSDVKSLSYARSTSLRRMVKKLGVDDVIVISPHGDVVEGSMSNLIARKGNTVYAPGANSGALPGITRQIIIEEILNSGYQLSEKLDLDMLYKCEEAMLTSSLNGVRRVQQIDQHHYDKARAVLYEHIQQQYLSLITSE